MLEVATRSTTRRVRWRLGDWATSVSMLELMFVIGDAIELEDCVGGSHGAKATGQGTDGNGIEFAQD